MASEPIASSDRIGLLRKMAVFGALKTESLELILGHSRDIQVAAGSFFVREGDRGDSLFVLESGNVVVERSWDDRIVELGRLGEGDCFGEMALIDFQSRSASVKATADCQAIEVPSRALRELYKSDVEQYAIIMMNLGREVSRRLRVADDFLFRLQQISAEVI